MSLFNRLAKIGRSQSIHRMYHRWTQCVSIHIIHFNTLPFGGYKGSHIAMMIELLAGPLVGETASYASRSRDSGDGGPPQGGEFILAMNPDMLSGADWQAESEAFLAKLDALEGVRVRVAGARRWRRRAAAIVAKHRPRTRVCLERSLAA